MWEWEANSCFLPSHPLSRLQISLPPSSSLLHNPPPPSLFNTPPPSDLSVRNPTSHSPFIPLSLPLSFTTWPGGQALPPPPVPPSPPPPYPPPPRCRPPRHRRDLGRDPLRAMVFDRAAARSRAGQHEKAGHDGRCGIQRRERSTTAMQVLPIRV